MTTDQEINAHLNPDPPGNLPVDRAARIAEDLNRDNRDPGEDEETSWASIDLADALTGADLPPPTVLDTDFGESLLYSGRVHSFQGESETNKSWAAQMAANQTISNSADVLYIDFEDDERSVIGRLLALGASAATIRDHFVYLRPEEPLRDQHNRHTPGGTALDQLLERRRFALCVIDGVTEAMVTEGLDLNSNADAAAWSRRLPKRVAQHGTAVVVIDHVTKSKENRGRFAIGAQHKLSGLNGAAYSFTMLRPLGRASGTKEIEGIVAIGVEKDRVGYVRGWAANKEVGHLVITAWPDGKVTARISRKPDKAIADQRTVDDIVNYLTQYDGASQRKIEDNVPGRSEHVRGALSWLVESGRVAVELKGMAHLHSLTAKGRDETEALHAVA